MPPFGWTISQPTHPRSSHLQEHAHAPPHLREEFLNPYCLAAGDQPASVGSHEGFSPGATTCQFTHRGLRGPERLTTATGSCAIVNKIRKHLLIRTFFLKLRLRDSDPQPSILENAKAGLSPSKLRGRAFWTPERWNDTK